MKGRSLSRNLTHLSTLALDKKNWEQPPFSLLYTLFYSEAKLYQLPSGFLAPAFSAARPIIMVTTIAIIVTTTA